MFAMSAMSDMSDPHTLPPSLPVPVDDGGAVHLNGRVLPDLVLPSTSGAGVNLRAAGTPRCVFFFYPRTGVPGQPPGPGFGGEDWDSIPGARGCTPQSCGFRDLHAEFAGLQTPVFGVSTNTTEHQLAFRRRNHVGFDFLSDSSLALTRALALPTFEFPVESGGPDTLLRRAAWYCENGVIVRVWYPVFPPGENAARVLEWLRVRRSISIDPINLVTPVTPVTPGDIDFVREELCTHWITPSIWSRGVRYEADRLPGFIARIDGRPVGLVTLAFAEHGAPEGECELVTLSSRDENRGVGRALLDAALGAARAAGCRRIFLTTSNDNLRALSLYQRHGWVMAALHRGMMDDYRSQQKPIPRVAPNGIPIRDEIELERVLADPA